MGKVSPSQSQGWMLALRLPPSLRAGDRRGEGTVPAGCPGTAQPGQAQHPCSELQGRRTGLPKGEEDLLPGLAWGHVLPALPLPAPGAAPAPNPMGRGMEQGPQTHCMTLGNLILLSFACRETR